MKGFVRIWDVYQNFHDNYTVGAEIEVSFSISYENGHCISAKINFHSHKHVTRQDIMVYIENYFKGELKLVV